MNPTSAGGWEIANRITRTLFLLCSIPLVWIAAQLGLVHSILFLFLIFMVPRTFVTRGILLLRRKLVIGWWRRLATREGKLFAGQFALRTAFWMLSLRVTTFAGFGLGALGLVFQLLLHFTTPGETVVLDPPLRGEWYVIHGGRGALFNHHYPHPEQSHALDLLKVGLGRTFRGDAGKVESYYAWDQEVIAPGDGEVVHVVNNALDGKIGGYNVTAPEGNSIVLKLRDGRYVLLAHLKRGSVRVAAGAAVKTGQVLAACGNSGNSTEPHLHFQVQSHASARDDANRTFPIRFTRGGYLRRNDRPDFGR
jgi:hypothetical protein